MNRRQLSYFRNKLLDWREDLIRDSSQTLVNLQETTVAEPDLTDRASAESDRSLELRTRDRERTKREIAAYVAEGSIDADKAVAMMKAGKESSGEEEA